MLVGGMPEVVKKCVDTHDFLQCQEIQDDMVLSYEDDFSKYRKKFDPMLLRLVMRSAAVQATNKFEYSRVGEACEAGAIKKALDWRCCSLPGFLFPLTIRLPTDYPWAVRPTVPIGRCCCLIRG